MGIVRYAVNLAAKLLFIARAYRSKGIKYLHFSIVINVHLLHAVSYKILLLHRGQVFPYIADVLYVILRSCDPCGSRAILLLSFFLLLDRFNAIPLCNDLLYEYGIRLISRRAC